MEYRLRRLLSEKKKLFMILFLILFPSVEILQVFYESWKVERELPYAMYATFLSGYSRGHVVQVLYLWFLPLYLLIINGEECIEEFQTGYKNVLVCKFGKRKYIRSKLQSAFLRSGCVVGIGLCLNFILVQIAYRGGRHLRYEGKYKVFDPRIMPETSLFEWSYTHPVWANIMYIAVAILFAALVGTVGTMLAIVLHDRRLVYAITFALWFVPIIFKNSFMFVFQPFCEYGLDVVLPLAFGVAGVFLLVIVGMTVWEARYIEV